MSRLDSNTSESQTTDSFEPVTGEHHLRPAAALETDPPSSVPAWEPEAGDFS